MSILPTYEEAPLRAIICPTYRLQRLVTFTTFWFVIAFAMATADIAWSQTAHFAGTQSVVASSGLSNPWGVAVDGNGNVYIADLNNYRVVKVPWTGGGYGQPVTLADRTTDGSIFEPEGVAVDGNGNVYIANLGEGYGNIVKIPWTGSAYGPEVTLISYSQATSQGLYFPNNVAVDGGGNVYVAWGLQVTKLPWTGSAYGSLVTVASSGLTSPYGLAVDAAGDVFIANGGNGVAGSVLEVPWTNGAYGTPVTLASVSTYGSSFRPEGLALDANGDLFIADQADQKLLELPWTGTAYGTSVTLADTTTNPDFGPLGLATDGSGNLYVADNNVTTGNSNNLVLKQNLSVGNFGTFNVGSSSSAVTELFRFDTGGTIGTPSVVTQGATNLDFTDAGTGTCTTNGTTHTYNAGDSCTVDVTFEPKAPGARYGAAVLTNGSGSVIATGYAQGTGVGPQVIFGPGAQSTLSLSGVNNPFAVAVDAVGNLYIANAITAYGTSNSVVKETWNGTGYTQSTIVTGLGYPTGLAVDGAGNVYIADQDGLVVLKETPSATGYTQSTVDSTLGTVGGLAVDGSGNVYVGRGGIGVEKETLSGGTYTRSEIFNTFYADGIAVDQAGDLYIAASGGTLGQALLKETLSNGSYVQSTIGAGLNGPHAISVDGTGNLFVVDGYGTSSRVLEESPTTGGYRQSVVGNSLNAPIGLAVDGPGNLYIASDEAGSVWKMDFANPPSLSFATTAYGSTSADSPQTVTVQNHGNAALTFPIPVSGNNPSIAPSFVLNDNAPSACPIVDSESSAAGTLAAGASCELSVSFVPATSGAISGSLVLTDNALNAAAPGYTAQSISLSGTSTPGIALGSSATAAFAATQVTFTATLSSSSQTGTVTFFDGTTQLGTATLSGGSAVYTTSSLAAGTHSITAAYAGSSNFPAVTSVAVTENIVSLTAGPATGGSTSATASPGGQATYNLAFTPPSGMTFPAAIQLSVSGLPTGATATFNPTSIPAGAGATNVTLTVNLPASAAANLPGRPFGKGTFPVAFALLLLPFAGSFRRAGRSWPYARLILLGSLAAFAASGLVGCGGGGSSSKSQPQNYTLTVNAASGTFSQNTTLMLTVE